MSSQSKREVIPGVKIEAGIMFFMRHLSRGGQRIHCLDLQSIVLAGKVWN